MTHEMSHKKRNFSVNLTVPYEMINHKWYQLGQYTAVLGQYTALLAGTIAKERNSLIENIEVGNTLRHKIYPLTFNLNRL